MIFLFFTRLALYILAFSLPVFHPGIVISYDVVGWWLFFVLVPAEMLTAYFLSPPRLGAKLWLFTGAFLIIVSITFVSGIGSTSLLFIGGGIFAFVSTLLVFKTGVRGRTVATIEIFLLGLLYYRMLSFSRASEEIARESSGIAQAILFLCIGAFLVHSLVLYFSAFKGRRDRKELALFFAFVVPLILLIALLMPPDFVQHSVVFNRLRDEPNPDLIPLDEYADALPDGNLRSDELGDRFDGGREGQGEGEEGEGESPSLEGYPSDRWGDQEMSGESEEQRQYAVMVVAADRDPVYAADGYFGEFDKEKGFVYSREEPLNEIVFIRLLETWKNRLLASDVKRQDHENFFLSTIPDRVMAYQPKAVEPTILNRRYHPFSYSYTAVSSVSDTSIEDWISVEGLSARERELMKEYLFIPLREEDRQRFQSYLDEILNGKSGYFEKIEAILKSYSSYQYDIGFDDEVSVPKMLRFLYDVKQGDCTEFSNTTAILARLAGIPSRVVTGYLGARSLQTRAHRRGVMVLWDAIEDLQRFSPEELLLVTSAHRHSWTQIYMPDYGWVDFETTSFAIPPMGSGNPSNMNVVIPILQEGPEPVPGFKFPWILMLRSLGVLVLVGVLGAYLLRYGRETYLVLLSKTEGVRALRALQQVLLMRLAAEGYPVKDHSETIQEYSIEHPELTDFASLYTLLRYRQRMPSDDRGSSWERLRDTYRDVLDQNRKPGFLNFFKRVFSLKGLLYL